jgi:hypothetical protein
MGVAGFAAEMTTGPIGKLSGALAEGVGLFVESPALLCEEFASVMTSLSWLEDVIGSSTAVACATRAAQTGQAYL